MVSGKKNHMHMAMGNDKPPKTQVARMFMATSILGIEKLKVSSGMANYMM